MSGTAGFGMAVEVTAWMRREENHLENSICFIDKPILRFRVAGLRL